MGINDLNSVFAGAERICNGMKQVTGNINDAINDINDVSRRNVDSYSGWNSFNQPQSTIQPGYPTPPIPPFQVYPGFTNESYGM